MLYMPEVVNVREFTTHVPVCDRWCLHCLQGSNMGTLLVVHNN